MEFMHVPEYYSIMSPNVRGIEFVTRKISDGVARIHLGLSGSYFFRKP